MWTSPKSRVANSWKSSCARARDIYCGVARDTYTLYVLFAPHIIQMGRRNYFIACSLLYTGESPDMWQICNDALRNRVTSIGPLSIPIYIHTGYILYLGVSLSLSDCTEYNFFFNKIKILLSYTYRAYTRALHSHLAHPYTARGV